MIRVTRAWRRLVCGGIAGAALLAAFHAGRASALRLWASALTWLVSLVYIAEVAFFLWLLMRETRRADAARAKVLTVTVAAGPPKEHWEALLRVDRVTRALASALKFRSMICSVCGLEMVMDEDSARDADAHPEWPRVCLRCVSEAKGIPYPPTTLSSAGEVG